MHPANALRQSSALVTVHGEKHSGSWAAHAQAWPRLAPNGTRPARLLGLVLLALLLVACEGYSQVGIRSNSHEDMDGETVKVKVSKANGTAKQEIEVGAGYPGGMLEADATLTVEKGNFRIELLGKDEEVTLTLEARDGQTVSGQGQMMVDSLTEANYRVTAGEAENVEYTIEYTFR